MRAFSDKQILSAALVFGVIAYWAKLRSGPISSSQLVTPPKPATPPKKA